MACKKLTKEMIMEAAKCKTDAEKAAFESKIKEQLSDEALNSVSGGTTDEDSWECEVCGATFASFWSAAGHAFAHIGDIFD